MKQFIRKKNNTCIPGSIAKLPSHIYYDIINKMNIKEGNSSLLNYFLNSNTKHVLYYFRAVQYRFKTLDRIPINKDDGESCITGEMKPIYVENEELEASGQAVIDVIPRIHYQIIQIGGQDAHAAQTSLGQMEPIKFKITADAEALDRAAIDALKTKPALAVKMTDSSFFIWKTGEKRNGISGRWYIEDDGTCVYQPKGLSWFYGTGEVALTLSEEASCTAVFTIEERSFLYWIPIGFVLFSLFLLWCIIGWIRQPKFNNQIMEIVVYTKFGSAIQESPRI